MNALMRKLILIPILFVLMFFPMIGFAGSSERLTLMRNLFEGAQLPVLNDTDLNQTWLCAEVSSRSVTNPFEVVLRKTGLAYTLLLGSGKSIVAVPSVSSNCWVGNFAEDTNYLRMSMSGELIAEFGSLDDSGTGLLSLINPNIHVKGYVTCSKRDLN
jgi:hypothetical protein